MRKNRFLLNLIAATAISLSVFGCDSSDSGAISDGSGAARAQTDAVATATGFLREYFIVAQRGNLDFTPEFSAGQSAPADATGAVIADTGDNEVDDGRALLFEVFGIVDSPLPNAKIGGSGAVDNAPTAPEVSAELNNTGTTGYHGVYVDPTGQFVIGMSRSKNRGGLNDPDTSIDQSLLQIHKLEFEAPLTDSYPPIIQFSSPLDPVSIREFQVNQGEFVAGGWSLTARQFYASINGDMISYAVDLNTGRMDVAAVADFPDGGAGINNAVQLLSTLDGRFVYALDNANDQIVTYSRNQGDGTLSAPVLTNTVVDPRGAAMDRSGKFIYVAGRSSNSLAGYRIEDDGGLTPIQLLSEFNTTNPADFGEPLGDVATHPGADQLFLASYSGKLQAFSIDPASGLLAQQAAPGVLLSGSRNTTNIEVEPTGRFVFSVQEADLDQFQDFVTVANGFPANVREDNIFANTNSATNGAGQPVYGPATQDANGRTVYALQIAVDDQFAGDLQVYRLNPDGSVRAESSTALLNPFGLSMFQRTVEPPGPIGGTTGGTTGGT
jgi:6-phosphogluconolactonase (cycloisomerase 2 family)